MPWWPTTSSPGRLVSLVRGPVFGDGGGPARRVVAEHQETFLNVRVPSLLIRRGLAALERIDRLWLGRY
jgi:hypothetical protein